MFLTVKMKARDLSAYVVADLTLFAFGFYALRIRKLGLYMFLMVIGAPASFAVLPASEMVAPQFGLHLGSAPHAWLAAATAALMNTALAIGLAALIAKLAKR